MPDIKILTEADLRSAISLDADAVTCIEQAFHLLATREVVMPPILSFHIPEHNGEVDVKTVTLVIKDMDADGRPDIVFAGRSGVGWFRNPGYESLGISPDTAVWERIVIAATGSEFTFCDHIVDGCGGRE